MSADGLADAHDLAVGSIRALAGALVHGVPFRAVADALDEDYGDALALDGDAEMILEAARNLDGEGVSVSVDTLLSEGIGRFSISHVSEMAASPDTLKHHANKVLTYLSFNRRATIGKRIIDLATRGEINPALDTQMAGILESGNTTGKRNRSAITSIRAADIKPEKVEYLGLGIPRGKITILDGDPGLGKSTLTADWAARVSSGTPFPGDNGRRTPGDVLILNFEDGASDTIVPRLAAAHADLIRVHILRGIRSPGDRFDSPLTFPRDLGALEAEAARASAKLIVIDPLMAALESKIDSHRDQDVRRVLAALAALAERTGAAIILVRHLNKNSNSPAIYRGGGSIGIVGAARAGFMVVKHPEDQTRRVLASTKNNLRTAPPALEFDLVNDPHEVVARVAYGSHLDLDADEILAVGRKPGPKAEKLSAAMTYLSEQIADGATWQEATRSAIDAGHTKSTVYRARREFQNSQVVRDMGIWEKEEEII